MSRQCILITELGQTERGVWECVCVHACVSVYVCVCFYYMKRNQWLLGKD